MEFGSLSLKEYGETIFKFIGGKALEKYAVIKSKREEEDARIKAVVSDLTYLRRSGTWIRALDSDAEQRRYIEDASVHCWLRDLKAVAYDIEDVNEEFKTHKKGECSRVFDRLYFADRIQEIKEEKDRIDKEKKNLLLREEEAVRRFKRTIGGPQEGSLQDDRRFHGRQQETEDVVAELLKFKGGDGVQVISIVGCCGSGKTSLARNILKDARIENHFYPIWVSLSEDYDLVRTIKEVIKAVPEGRECHESTLDLLQHHLKRIISNKRFLLVLDNMWITDFDFLEKLRTPLMFAAKGSKILVTTQNEDVANRMQTEYTVGLLGLPEDDGWLLFQDVVRTGDSELEAIGRDIVKKCHGFPLAIKAISSLLCSETNPDQWKLLSDELLENEEAAAAIIQSLKISYDHLPLDLKHCIAFCSTFPKDYEFDKDELVRLWMATKLIKRKSKETTQFEDLGERYFGNLLKRSFFRASDSNLNDSRKYKMPSLIHEVVHHLYIRHESLRVNQDETIHGESGRARYGLLYQHDKQPVKFNKMFKNKGLRALMLYGKNGELLKDDLIDLFERLRFLRLLDLSSSYLEDLPDSVCNLILLRYLSLHGTNIKILPETIGKLHHLQALQLGNCIQIHELPDSIGDLKFLRYLGLHNTSIRTLPETVSNLLKLRTLELGNCYKLEMLPKSLKNLVHLRHLGLQLDWDSWDRQIDIISMPPGIGCLTSLRHLSRFAVGSEPQCGLGELKNLKLRGKLCISKLEKVVSVNDAEAANLSGKRDIDSLMLRWSDAAFTESEILPEEDVIDRLQPHKDLQNLYVENYSGKEFPNWMRDPSFLKLETLKLINCKMCSSLPGVWKLPSLKTLQIKGLHGVKRFGTVLSGFENLETLDVSDMHNLESWFLIRDGQMSCLTALYISDCPNLICLSYLPPSIRTFELRNCRKLRDLNILPNLQDLVLESDSGSRLIWVQNLTSLTSLTLSKLTKIQDDHKGIFKNLTSLKNLKVQECNDLDSTDGLTNHSSLEYLEISSCSQLTKIDLPKNLKELRLYLCPRLESLQRELHLLSSLRVVEIHSVSLASMPKLPDGVETLVIKECSVLRKRCQENNDDWPNIQHISHIQVDQDPRQPFSRFQTMKNFFQPWKRRRQ